MITCRSCPFWKSSEGLEYGECRFGPPSFSDSLADILSNSHNSSCEDCHQRGWWPETHQEDFCGKHPNFPRYHASI